MSMIGNQPSYGKYYTLDAIITDGSTAYSLLKDTVAQTNLQAEQLIVSVNGAIQAPGSSFTVSGGTITFAEALTADDSVDFITVIGESHNVATVSDGAVSAAKLGSDVAVTNTPVRINSNTIDTNFTVGANQNAMVAGPIDINAEIIVQGTFTVV